VSRRIPRVMATAQDGPAAGDHFEVDRCPRRVRIAIDGQTGAHAILELDGDQPEPTERVEWYEARQVGHVCGGRRCTAIVHLHHLAGYVDADERRRDRQLALL
jgi:hypothetical protein